MTDTPVPDVREIAARAVETAGRCLHPGAESCEPSTFSRMVTGHRPDADALCTLVIWLGLSLRQFIRPAQRGAEGAHINEGNGS